MLAFSAQFHSQWLPSAFVVRALSLISTDFFFKRCYASNITFPNVMSLPFQRSLTLGLFSSEIFLLSRDPGHCKFSIHLPFLIFMLQNALIYINKHYCVEGLRSIVKRKLLDHTEPFWFFMLLQNSQFLL